MLKPSAPAPFTQGLHEAPLGLQRLAAVLGSSVIQTQLNEDNTLRNPMTPNRNSIQSPRVYRSTLTLFLATLSLFAIFTTQVRAAVVDVTIEYLQLFDQNSGAPPDAARLTEFSVLTSVGDGAVSPILNGPRGLIPLVDGSIFGGFSNRVDLDASFRLALIHSVSRWSRYHA